MSVCKGCGRNIIWGQTIEGKRIPLDPAAPTYREVDDEAGVPWLERSTAMVSHFSTCPKANDFSASKKSQKQESLFDQVKDPVEGYSNTDHEHF